MSYKEAGVDVEAGYESVLQIKKIVRPTFDKNVLSEIGMFGGSYAIDKKYKNPVLISGADGVGSKLIIAFMMDRHDTVGLDLVAMNVDDVVTMGAKPLFMLDYIGCCKLEPKLISLLVGGIAKGCKQAGCALIGGETAELPDLYRKGEYDLAGFAVGIVEKNRIINGSTIRSGDVVIGLASSGLHSNGFALARKVLFEMAGFNVNSSIKGLDGSLGEELLMPTKIYAKSVLELIDSVKVKGLAHITGGGLPENVSRILPKSTKAVIYRARWEPMLIFKLIKGYGNVDDSEMYKTLNMGIGMVAVVSKKDAPKTIKTLKSLGEKAYEIGVVVPGHGEVEII